MKNSVKISIIGAGATGGQMGALLVPRLGRGLMSFRDSTIVLADLKPEVAGAKALELRQAAAIENAHVNIVATGSVKLILRRPRTRTSSS